MRGNPTFRIEETNTAETAIAHCISVGECLHRLLSRSQRPEDVEELLEIATHVAVLKHMAQAQNDKQLRNGA